MLDECMEYLEKRTKQDTTFQYEVIIVSDGSKDATVEVAQQYVKEYSTNKIRVLALTQNRGKGGAVRLGMLSARGQQLLFADADGATKFTDLDKLDAQMKTLTEDWQDSAIIIGSRAHLEDEAIATRSFFRTILMHGFHFLVWLFAVRGIKDTQCGFKLFTRSAAQQLFQLQHVERWAFDVELLFLAQSLRIPINEVSVFWTEIDGSKITPVWTWIQMGMDLFLIWFRYWIGAWRFDSIEPRKLHSN